MIDQERQKLLNDYAATSRMFSDAVDRLRFLNTDVERFILRLAETGTAHRACEWYPPHAQEALSPVRPS